MRVPEPTYFPNDDVRDPTPEEERVIEILESSSLEPAMVDEVMSILANVVDQVIWERNKECSGCVARDISMEKANERA